MATTYYVSQAGAGSKNGSSLGNAWDMTSGTTGINNSGNWSNVSGTAGKLSPDDTLVINGTITSTFTFQNSGLSGHPITITFASGAKFSTGCWGTGSSAAMYAAGKSYIVIDGTNGLIENTSNGDGLATQNASHGLSVTGSGTDWEVKNLTVQNIYVHIYNTAMTLANYTTKCIAIDSISNLLVHNNNVSGAYVGAYLSGTASNVQLYSNIGSSCSTPFIIANSTGEVMTNVSIHDNDLTMGYNWTDPAGQNHNDGIHMFAVNGGTITTVAMYNNYAHGDPGQHSTGMFYWEGIVDAVDCYNNLGVATNNKCTDGYITASAGVTGLSCRILNNTIIGNGTSNTGGSGTLVYVQTGSYTVTIQNNIYSNCFVGIYNGIGTVNWSCDYNDYDCGNTGVGNGDVFKSSLASWQSYTSGDTHSTVSAANLTAGYALNSSSPGKGTGATWSSVFTTDATGATRSVPWDMGRYKFGAGPTGVTSALFGKVILTGNALLR